MKYPKLPALLKNRREMGSASSSSSSSSSRASPKQNASPSQRDCDCPISARVPVLPLTILRSDEERGRPLSRKVLTSSSYASSATGQSRLSSEQRPRVSYSYDEEAIRDEQQERRAEEKKRSFRRSLGGRSMN